MEAVTLVSAADTGDTASVMRLLAEGVDVNVPDKEGRYALRAASVRGHLGIVKMLIKAGANVNQVCKNGATPLYVASQNCHIETVLTLLGAGADANIATTNNATPLYVASQKGHQNVVHALLNARANVNTANASNITPLYVASWKGHYDIVQILLEAGADVNMTASVGESALWTACCNGHLDVVMALVRAGANVNQPNKNNATPLYVASQNGHRTIVQVLLEAGATVNVAKIGNLTPLIAACSKGHCNVVQTLLGADPDLNVLSCDGKTAFDVALQNGFLYICEVLVEHLSKATTSKADKSITDRLRETVRYTSMHSQQTYSAGLAAGSDMDVTISEELSSISTPQTPNTELQQQLENTEKKLNNVTRQKESIAQQLQDMSHQKEEVEQRLLDMKKQNEETEKKLFEMKQLNLELEERLHDISQQKQQAELEIHLMRQQQEEAERHFSQQLLDMMQRNEALVQQRSEALVQQRSEALVQQRSEALVQQMRLQAQRSEDRVMRVEQELRVCRQQLVLARQQNDCHTQLNAQHIQMKLDTFKCGWVVERNEIQVIQDKPLGVGGWGEVKAALFRGTKVAAKFIHEEIISPNNIELFIREMNMAASVRHPNLLLFIGASLDEDKPVIITELMPTNLRTVVHTLSRDQIISIGIDVAKGLNYLHLMRPDPIIHRDISSANVLLERTELDNWRAKVSDYGSANFVSQIKTTGPGNASYSAPESLNPRLQSPKMDVYSYGLVLLEMATGQFPNVRLQAVQLEALLWQEMAAMVKSCICEEPDNRPDMKDLLLQLPKLYYYN